MEQTKKKSHRGIIILLIILGILGAAALYGYTELTSIKADVAQLRSDAKSLIKYIKLEKPEEAEKYAAKLDEDAAAFAERLDGPVYTLAEKLPKIGSELTNGKELLCIYSEASSELLHPALEYLALNPLSGLKTNTGINTAAAEGLLDFYLSLSPSIERVCAELGDIKLGIIDPDGKLNGYLNLVSQLSELVAESSEKLIKPLRAQLELCPLDELKNEDGFDMRAIKGYLDFLEEYMPGCREVMESLAELDLGEPDKNGAVSQYTDIITSLIDLYDDSREYIDLANAFIGDGSDRLYLIGAQDSSELYAAGGFPGSMGTVRIKDGRLALGKFSGVHDFFFYGYSKDARPTAQESSLFPGMKDFAWDAGYCPDFTRVGPMWAGCYEGKNDEALDGVISMTPIVIERLLKIVGSIDISDGETLSVDNATAYLQYVVYDRYMNQYNKTYRGNAYSDAIFAEVAQKAMDKLVSSFKVSDLPKYIDMMRECFADRTIMLWFADESEQAAAVAAGCDGGLGHDPEDPEIGLFFSTVSACKMGWWMDIDYELSDPVVNEDGSRSYTLTAYFCNGMTKVEAPLYSRYIGTQRFGHFTSECVIVGPAGGSITDVQVEGIRYRSEEYQELPIVESRPGIGPEEKVTFVCTVTTAPGVEKVPRIVMTPTLTSTRLKYIAENGPAYE